MPMYWNGALPENMYAGQDEIEDIYIGSKHVWGWHTLTLVCEGLEDQVIRFRFGAGVENIPAPKLNENVIQSMKDAIKNSAGYPKDSNIDITFNEMFGNSIINIPLTKSSSENIIVIQNSLFIFFNI